MIDPALDAAVAEAEALLDGGDPIAAAARVEAHEAAIETHERLALLWAALLTAVGDARVLARQLRRLSAAWPRHPLIALRCAAAATRWADPWPATDARDPLAALGAEFAARCIDGGGATERFIAPLHLALARALARSGPRHDDKALAAFEVALTADPDDARGWADLARFHQQRRRFAQGLGAAREALRHRPDDKPARWTAAVCATALADPGAAAEWAALKHLADGADPAGRPRVEGLPAVEVVLWRTTPLHLDRGAPVAARVAHADPVAARSAPPPTHDGAPAAAHAPTPAHAGTPAAAPGPDPAQPGTDDPEADAPAGEALWVEPISPCHGRVISPTALELPADYDDVILWDPHPLSFRVVGDAEVPRFGALAVLARGASRTWRYHAPPALDPAAAERRLPPGCRLYPFAGRVSAAAAHDGKLVAPRALDRAALEAALAAAGLTLA